MSKTVRVTFIPRFANKPYVPQLEAQLAALGTDVIRLGTSTLSLIGGFLWTRPHVVHLQWLHPFHMGGYSVTAFVRAVTLISGWFVLRLFRRRFVWTVHNLKDHDDRHPRVARMLTGFVARRADAVIVHCEFAKQAVLRRFPKRDQSSVYVIPHGNYCLSYTNTISREDARQRLGLRAKDFVILFFGQIRRYKAIDRLIEAFRDLPDPDVRLVIAGRVAVPEDERNLRAFVDQDSRIMFRPGFIPDDDVQIYLNSCDVMACPFEDILTSGSVVLGSSFARPCIAPRLGCIPEQIAEGDSFLYDPDRPGALRETLARAINSRDRLAGMGERSRVQASNWSWRRVAQMTLAVYRKICSA